MRTDQKEERHGRFEDAKICLRKLKICQVLTVGAGKFILTLLQ
jgi:hypothetical protein